MIRLQLSISFRFAFLTITQSHESSQSFLKTTENLTNTEYRKLTTLVHKKRLGSLNQSVLHISHASVTPSPSSLPFQHANSLSTWQSKENMDSLNVYRSIRKRLVKQGE